MVIVDKADKVKQLIQNGKSKGFVLYDEIDDLLPPGFEAADDFEDILAELAKYSIGVREEPEQDPDNASDDGVKLLDELGLQNHGDDAGDLEVIRIYLDEVGSTPRLTREEEVALAKRINPRGPESEAAMRQLIEANLRAVVRTAKHYVRGGFRLLDLLQEGNIGLMKAVERFDPVRGYRFSPYAVWWVRRAMMQTLSQSQQD